MLCAISGEAPEHPVASKKSGNIFEKRLVEAYISENGTDPVNGEDLTVEDLIDLKQSRVVRPRPPTHSSIPALLSSFQNEWDALVLESFTLKQQLAETRQELSAALYYNDSAQRVIARLQKERDEARDALSRVTINSSTNGHPAANGDAMQVDGQGLPQDIIARVEETQARLSATRRKRPVPEDWATGDNITSYDVQKQADTQFTGAKTLAADETGDFFLTGDSDGSIGVYDLAQSAFTTRTSLGAGAVLNGAWCGDRPAVATSSGAVVIVQEGQVQAKFSQHAGAATAVAAHPCGDVLASVGVDKSAVLYDVQNGKVLTQVFSDSELSSVAFHPDGHLLAAGAKNGSIKLYDVKTFSLAHTFEPTSACPIISVEFSENGTWLASASEGQSTITVWDLRKLAALKVIEAGSEITGISWDYTGQYLAACGPGGIVVSQYAKKEKAWSEPLRKAISAVDVAWGTGAKSLLALTGDGFNIPPAHTPFFHNTPSRLSTLVDNYTATSAATPSIDQSSNDEQPVRQSNHVNSLVLPPIRYQGDGLDLRRPVMSTTAAQVIDLTEDDRDLQRHSSAISSPQNSQAAIPTRPREPRLPRFGRNIIDLDSEDDNLQRGTYTDSHSGTHTTRPTHLTFETDPPHRIHPRFSQLRRPHRRPTPAPEIESDEVVEVSSRAVSGQGRREQTLAELADLRMRGEGAYPYTDQIDLTAEEDDDVVELNSRPRDNGVNMQAPTNGGLGTRTADNEGGGAFGIGHLANLIRGEGRLMDHLMRRMHAFPPPQRRATQFPRAFDLPDFDYQEVGFQLGEELPARHRPPTPPYQAPPPPGTGMTRSPQEDEIVVCPNCGDELAVGEDEVKQQVFIIKSCGHAYCGSCSQNRHVGNRSQSKKGKARVDDGEAPPLKRCVVDGCNKPVTSKSLIQKVSSRDRQTFLKPKQIYLILYNTISAFLWLVVLGRTVSISAIHGPKHVYLGAGNFTKWTQTLAALEVLHAATGVVRAPLFTTLMQVASRFLLVWGVVDIFPRTCGSGSAAYASMLLAWSVTEVIRYSFFAINLATGSVPSVLMWLRYNTFFALYPLGISSECWLVYLATGPAGKRDITYEWALRAILFIYVPGSYVLYTHMMAQRRKVMRGLREKKAN
ncbi:PTPLA-domain-containing protein [Polychaeton citri CBS 116435]|uniref:Pre-mRNA-processing factor 19 n=1 Tax=Polychaeton citri CBS 116435 TaxID=1314669 RepID=A0A9P4UNG3_9PEZI|nr:PTPLA-domain-containing protein [Polychaeton citri CBS 116435]